MLAFWAVDDSDEALRRELRGDFLRSLDRRVVEMASLLEALAEDPESRDGLEKLHGLFHDLAGTGSMFGFPKVTAIGREGELGANDLIRANVAPNVSHLKRWRTLVDWLRKELPPAKELYTPREDPGEE